MKQEDIAKALDALGKSGITVAGDIVIEKHVEYEIGNVENGGTGIVINGRETDRKTPQTNEPPAADSQERDEELFHFIHPMVDSAHEWQVHDEVKRLVRRQGLQDICLYLLQMVKEKKILLPPMPSVAYAELVRMGMPSGDGFSESTFRKYYNNK